MSALPNRPNRPSLESLRLRPVGETVALPAELLALLQQEAASGLKAAKAMADWLDGAIALRFADRAQALFREAGKDTGTIYFDDDGVIVEADLPKKVEWDQALLAALVERIRASGEGPAQYVDIAFKVPERKYSAWPDSIRNVFAPARTVKTGKPTFRLAIISEDAR